MLERIEEAFEDLVRGKSRNVFSTILLLSGGVAKQTPTARL